MSETSVTIEPETTTKKEKKTRKKTSEKIEPEVPQFTLAEGLVSTVKLDAKDCPIALVTVFSDRAEVTRNVTVTLQKGNHDILIRGLTNSLDKNSVRVSGGKGTATILEVSTDSRKDTADVSDKVAALTKEREKLQDDQELVTEHLARVAKELHLLDTWSTVALNPINKRLQTDPTVPSLNFLSDVSLTQAANFFEFYQKNLTRLDEQKHSLEKQSKELTNKIQQLWDEINSLNANASSRNALWKKDVTISLHVAADGEVALQLSYVVNNATWNALYDCRVDTKVNSLQLIYYGTIQQNSGEDWIDARISLSTASPSVGGAPPLLPTQKVQFKTFITPLHSLPRSLSSRGAAHTNYAVQNAIFAKPMVQKADFSRKISSAQEIEEDLMSLEEAPPVSVLTATATSGTSSTTFNIPRAATIKSDNKPHKVTIAVIADLKPRFTYTIVPSRSPHAYLKASVTNTTKDVPFLAGTMNVFMDNNYITSTSIHNVNPLEEFAMYLGTDAGIRVDFKPEKKYNETQGYVNKVAVQRVDHETEIKNTKSFEVAVVVIDQLPLSPDEKIKVKPIEPDLKDTPKGYFSVTLNKDNNIEWRANIPAGGKHTVHFSYSIEYPKDKEIELV